MNCADVRPLTDFPNKLVGRCITEDTHLAKLGRQTGRDRHFGFFRKLPGIICGKQLKLFSQVSDRQWHHLHMDWLLPF